jgi:hypothetical protein
VRRGGGRACHLNLEFECCLLLAIMTN